MRVQQRHDGSLVFGYLDTASTGRGDAYDTVLVRGGRPARMSRYGFGELSACDISCDGGAHILSRPAHSARGRGYALGLLLSGRGRLEQDGRTAPMTAGDFVLYSGERPFQLDLGGPHRYFVLDLGEGDYGLPEHTGRFTADPALSRSPVGPVLTAMLAQTARSAPELGPMARRDMGGHITAVLRTLLQETIGRCAVPDNRAALLEQVLEYIDHRLGEDLSPVSIAAAHHVSVRYLHSLFQEQGDTVGSHIRRGRLERVRRDLAAPELAHLPAYAIAARWGIRDASHLSRLFRAEFGLSPRRFRRRALGG